MGWLTLDNWMQKNTPFKSKHDKQVASAHIREVKCMGLETPDAESLLLD
jgi:hypothetical protein